MVTRVTDGNNKIWIKIDKSIKSLGVATYQFVYSCKDDFNEQQLDFPFRIIVNDADVAPKSSP